MTLPSSESIKQEVEAFRIEYEKVLAKIKSVMVQELSMRLSAFPVTPAVLTSYPFFENKSKMVDEYMSSIDIVVSGNKLSLVVDKDVLAANGLPTHLMNILEYGNRVVPPFPHIRVALQSLAPYVSQVVQGVQSQVA